MLVENETASDHTQPKATESDQVAMSSDKHSKSNETKMIGTLAHGSVPVSDYYKQSVYDNHDNKIGDVNDILLGTTGKIEAVIIGVGGFLGIGEKSVAVPFSSLKITEKNGSRYLVIETTKEALESVLVTCSTAVKKCGSLSQSRASLCFFRFAPTMEPGLSAGLCPFGRLKGCGTTALLFSACGRDRRRSERRQGRWPHGRNAGSHRGEGGERFRLRREQEFRVEKRPNHRLAKRRA